MTPPRLQTLAGISFVLAITAAPAPAQNAGPTPVQLRAQPASLAITAGQAVALRITAFDASGEAIAAAVRLGVPRSGVDVSSWVENGTVRGVAAGTYQLVATAVGAPEGGDPASVTVPITVTWPPISRVEIAVGPGRLYTGTTLRHDAAAIHADGSELPGAAFGWSSSDPDVATVDRWGQVRAVSTGAVTIRARAEGVGAAITYQVDAFPAARLELTGGADDIRTGDVQTFTATAYDEEGSVIEDLPVAWSHRYEPADGVVAPPATGYLGGNRFVADVPGLHTVVVSAGPLRTERSFEVSQRDVVQRVQVLGHGSVSSHYTSDVWPFEGMDGRDYAMTGSRQGMSHAYIWNITDPSNIFKTDSVMVDARSVNDVKVSPNGRYGVISREGASNRRNGVVILDLQDPAHPTIASTYDRDLTGGVHNVFATNDHLFALSGGLKYIILDMGDLSNPRYVSEYDHPDSRIHDLWVHDGLVYSAEWETGVVVVDVGNGRWGGSIENPVFVTSFPLPTGETHAVFPYLQEATGTFYLFVGDEITNRRGLAWEGAGPDFRQPYDPETGRGGYPRATSGYIQIVDFSDPERPEMVARYEVPEFGTHNIWVEDDVLYQAYYEGGARMVDVSGDLMGNLYTQGREIAVFKAHDPLGWIANAPGAWSVIPFKGNIYFSDNTSGLWAIKLLPRDNLAM